MIRKSADQILLVLASLVMVVSLYQLYFKPYQRSTSEEPLILATLLDPIKTVKFKEGQSFSWRDAKKGLALADGDKLYTHNQAQADIDFLNGPKLTLSANTLVQIKTAEEGLGLDLGSGSFTTSFNSSTDHITLILGKRRFVLSAKGKKAKVKIRKTKNKADITVVSGNVKLREVIAKPTKVEASSTQPTEEDAFEDEAFEELVAGQTYTKEETEIEVEETTLEAPILITEEDSISAVTYMSATTWPIKWQATQESEAEEKVSYEIEWQQNGLLKRETLQTENFTLPVQGLLEGENEVEWRVREVSSKNSSPWTDWQKLNVERKPPLKQFPETGSEIILEKPNQEVTFRWQEEASGKNYQFEVSQDSRFQEKTYREKLAGTSLKVPLGAAGTYYWRVKVVDDKGRTRLGAPVEIKVKPAPPPEPIKLKEKYKFKIKGSFYSFPRPLWMNILKLLISPSFAQGNQENVKLSWPKERLAKSYILKFYNKKEDVIKEVEVSNNSYTWKRPKAGTYTWEILIRDFWDRVGEPSNRSTIEIEKVVVAKKANRVKIKKKKPLKKKLVKTPEKRKRKLVKRQIKKVKKAETSRSWSVFQNFSQSSIESTSTALQADADGPFLQSVGLIKYTSLFQSPLEIGASLGKGKAFEDLDYWQGKVWTSMVFTPSWLGKWRLEAGPAVYWQTVFEALGSNVTAANELLFTGQVGVLRDFNFFGLSHLFKFSSAFGQATALSFEWKTLLVHMKKLPVYIGVQYESLSFETEDSSSVVQEHKRSSLGLLWQMTWP